VKGVIHIKDWLRINKTKSNPKNTKKKKLNKCKWKNLMIQVLLMKINKNITVDALIKNIKKTIHLFFDGRHRS
jgi:hypothetical protein